MHGPTFMANPLSRVSRSSNSLSVRGTSSGQAVFRRVSRSGQCWRRCSLVIVERYFRGTFPAARYILFNRCDGVLQSVVVPGSPPQHDDLVSSVQLVAVVRFSCVLDDAGAIPFCVRCHHHHHHHQSLNREGRWGTTDDFATSFLHSSLFSTALWDLPNSRPVHPCTDSMYG